MDVFISYSHQDRAWKDRVVTFMRCMKKQRQFDYATWDDGQIHPSENWADVIGDAIERAKVAVLLVSADFLSSDFINDIEVPLLLKRRQRGVLAVMPLIVRPCPWEVVDWLAAIQLHPSEGSPLSACGEAEIEEHLKQLALELERLVNQGEAAAKAPKGLPDSETAARDDYHLMNEQEVRDFLRERLGQTPLDVLRIYSIKSQRTWLVTTPGRLYCLLDSRRTRNGNRVLQWQLPLEADIPVRVRDRTGYKASGLIDIGKRQNWLYSHRLHRNPDGLRERVRGMIEAARHS